MVTSWFSILIAIGAIAIVITACVGTGYFLYKNRPKPDDRQYFWGDR